MINFKKNKKDKSSFGRILPPKEKKIKRDFLKRSSKNSGWKNR